MTKRFSDYLTRHLLPATERAGWEALSTLLTKAVEEKAERDAAVAATEEVADVVVAVAEDAAVAEEAEANEDCLNDEGRMSSVKLERGSEFLPR